ncbi:ARM repeat-containing protein [Meira miltonrushii]|uniref:ARM repeat-containing protein n=1 Tax=Meira miltonrushii TaxID=1280837 RepID=A0A316VDK6_9BASI|nr:ARM repeat-containing protein [Meira miltonrushii]PWN34353.1 ARM repeat-containing protein [Meira miltonrushii]
MDALYQCLSHTLDPNPNTRKAAELELRKLEAHPGMLPSALQLVSRNDVDLSVRQATTIYIKNRIRRAWDAKSAALAELKQSPIPEADYSPVREALLPTLVSCPPQLRVHINASLGAVVRHDFPERWPKLVDEVKELLGAGDGSDVTRVYAGLAALLEIFRAFKWRDEKNIMAPLCESSLPIVLNIVRSILGSSNSSSAEAGSLIYLACKIYKTSISTNLTAYHQADENIVPWGQTLLQIVQKEVDPSQLPSDDEEREKASWWKAKKWAYFSLNKLFTKFGNPSQLPSNMKKYKAFAEKFVASFAPEILKVYLAQVEGKVNGKVWISDRAIYLILTFMSECVRAKSTWLLLKPHLGTLVEYFAFPLICHTEADDELWELDPTDFVRTQLDPMDDYGSPRAAAANLFQVLVQKRMKGAFMPILEFLTNVLNNYPASKTPAQKEGALNLIKLLDDAMLSHPSTAPSLEGLLTQHVVPDLRSNHRFLRFRAADVVAALGGKMSWKDSKSLESAFQGIMATLEDPEIPVRVQGANAISSLIDHSEVQEAMAPNAGRLMQELLKLSDEVELDVLTEAKSRVVDAFSEELLPFSTKLCEQLAQSYFRLMRSNIEAAKKAEDMGSVAREMDPSVLEDRGEEDKMFAALSCLSTMYQVLSSAEHRPDILAQLEKIVLPVVQFTLQENLVEMFDDCFDLTDVLTFYQKRISDDMWGNFRLMYQTFKTSGIDYLAEMLATFDNVITYGSQAFESNAELRHIIFDIFQTAMTSEQLGTSDHIAALKLADVFLLVLKSHMQEAVPAVINLALPHLADGQVTPLRKWATLVILDALCFNTVPALQALEAAQATQAFFASVLTIIGKFTRVNEKKVIAASFLSILGLDPAQTPATVQQGQPALLVGLLQNLVSLPKAVQKAKEEQEAFENLEDESGDNISGSFQIDDSKDADDDVIDEDNEYLELLAREGDRMRARAEAQAAGQDFEEEVDYGSDDEDDDDEGEMVYYSPMNQVPVFEGLRTLLANNPRVQQIASSLPSEDQQLLQNVSQFKDEELPLPPNADIPVA